MDFRIFMINASVNSICAQDPPGLLQGICQSWGWGICKFCAAWGLGICRPQGYSQAFDTYIVSYQNITTQRILLEKQAYWLIYQRQEKSEEGCKGMFSPTLGDLTAQETPPPGICHPRQKKKANARGSARGGGGLGAAGIDCSMLTLFPNAAVNDFTKLQYIRTRPAIALFRTKNRLPESHFSQSTFHGGSCS